MSLLPSIFNRADLFGRGGSSLFPFGDSALWPLDQTVDWFDPFDELDRSLSRNLHWFAKPEFVGDWAVGAFPSVPQKYRITVDCAGYKPESIKTDVDAKGKKLVVSAKEESRGVEGSDDFSAKHFKKTYQLPDNALPDKMVSFMAANGQLVIDVPLGETQALPVASLFPQIVDADEAGGGGKQVTMRFNVPAHIDPSKVHVTIKDRDIIFRAEDQVKKPDGVSRFHYYQRTTLPENTQTAQLKCFQDQNQVIVQAPLALDQGKSGFRKVPIERWSQQQQQQQLPSSQQHQQQQQQIPSQQQQQQQKQQQQQQQQHHQSNNKK